MIIFLSISLSMRFVCSTELSHGEGSFEYPQHMFWLRNKENNFQLRTLIWGPGPCQRHQVLFGQILQRRNKVNAACRYMLYNWNTAI